MTKHKRDQRGSSSSSGTSPTELKKVKMSEEAVELSSLKDLIQNLTETMESNFGKLHEELSAIRQEMKHEIDLVKENVKSVEKSVEELWATVEDLKEETKALKDTKKAQEQEVEGLRSLLMKTKAELKEEKEKIIELEDYTRRENLKFNNIPEANDEGATQSSKQVILDILDSNKINKTNILQLAGLRRSIPSPLRDGIDRRRPIPSPLRDKDWLPSINPPTFVIDDNIFDVTTKKSKEFYALLIKDKAQLPYIAYKLQNDFNFTSDQLKQIFQLPHSVTLEAYVKAFQYKVLNSILYTNTKLYKMGFRTNDLCSFCKGQPESLNHLLFHCPYSKQFWKDFEIYWCIISNQKIRLSLQNVLVGIITETSDPLHIMLNYFIIIGKLFLWNCRNKQILPNIHGFRAKIVAKYETEKIISRKEFFTKKWILSPYLS